MRIWIRIFILSTVVTICAIAVTGIFTIRAGYRALLDGEIRWLMGQSRQAAVLVANLFQTSWFLSGGIPQSYVGSSSGAGLLRSLGWNAASNIEVFWRSGELLYSENRPFTGRSPQDREEITAALKGRTTYLVRHVDSTPMLFISAPAQILQE